MDGGAGAAAGSGAGAGVRQGVVLRGLTVGAGLLCFLLALQLLDLHLAGIPQGRVGRRVHTCRNPRGQVQTAPPQNPSACPELESPPGTLTGSITVDVALHHLTDKVTEGGVRRAGVIVIHTVTAAAE